MTTGKVSAVSPVAESECSPMVVYFDGVCGFCNATVNFLMRLDRRGKLRFAPLQGETAQERLSPQDLENLNTIIVSRGDRNYRRSAAVVRILWELGGLWSILGTCLWLIPLPLRDLGYKIFAGNRYRILGKREACRLPLPEERDRILP